MASTEPDAPYLSVVVTARNDDHGGNLLGRMQVFLDAWINQAKRHNLSSELIVVEWNPPADRARLADALRWPADTGPCRVRIIEVPPQIHARYRHAAALPLYQMIAKNAGIRRARGEFILATNIDIVFSDELAAFLAARRLEKSRMYRIDRHDVSSDVPVAAPLDEQLSYCRDHVIRLCACDGAFKLTPEGLRQNEADDITAPASAIHFGDGWSCVERWDEHGPFRWIGDEAEIFARVPDGGGVLMLEVEPGSGACQSPQALQVLDENGSAAGEWSVAGRAILKLVCPPPGNSGFKSIRLRVPDGGRPLVDDLRIQNLRVFRCDWEESIRGSSQSSYFETARKSRPLLMRMLGAARSPRVMHRAVQLLKNRGTDVFGAGMEFWTGAAFHELEYAGGERFRWAGQDAQLLIRTKENHRLALLVEPGPSVGFQPFVLAVRRIGGEVLARAAIRRVTYVDVPVPATRGITTLVFSAEGGGLTPGEDPRTLNFRVFACDGVPGEAVQSDVPAKLTALTAGCRPPSINWDAHLAEAREQIAGMGKQDFLHTNACGDFTLMAREHWDEVRGYAELDLFSIHLDSLLCYAAHFAGAREERLCDPLRIYHIEHRIGTGWTPEGQEQLSARIAEKGIASVSHEDVLAIVAAMRRMHAPMIFNLEDWGLAGVTLNEITPAAAPSALGAIR